MKTIQLVKKISIAVIGLTVMMMVQPAYADRSNSIVGDGSKYSKSGSIAKKAAEYYYANPYISDSLSYEPTWYDRAKHDSVAVYHPAYRPNAYYFYSPQPSFYGIAPDVNGYEAHSYNGHLADSSQDITDTIMLFDSP